MYRRAWPRHVAQLKHIYIYIYIHITIFLPLIEINSEAKSENSSLKQN
jgi:hypothetical protein